MQGRSIFKSRKYKEHHKDIHQEEQPQGTSLSDSTRVEMKEKMLRVAREKGGVIHKGKAIRLTAETLQSQKKERVGPIFNILKENNFQHRISYLAKLSFISEGEIKYPMDKQLLRDFFHHQTCPIRAPKRGTTHRKDQPVPAIQKSN